MLNDHWCETQSCYFLSFFYYYYFILYLKYMLYKFWLKAFLISKISTVLSTQKCRTIYIFQIKIRIIIKWNKNSWSSIEPLFRSDILNTNSPDWFTLVLWHTNHYWLFNAKSCFYIYIKYMICKHIFYIQWNDQTVLFQTIQFSISQQS